MGERRETMIERVVHGIEDRVEEWRRQDTARKMEAEANRDALWAEAAERERLLRDARDREAGDGSLARITDQHHLVFVVASEEFADALQDFSPEKERLIKVMPAADSGGGQGLRGSWLIFEDLG